QAASGRHPAQLLTRVVRVPGQVSPTGDNTHPRRPCPFVREAWQPLPPIHPAARGSPAALALRLAANQKELVRAPAVRGGVVLRALDCADAAEPIRRGAE